MTNLPGSSQTVVFVLRMKVFANTILEHYLQTVFAKTVCILSTSFTRGVWRRHERGIHHCNWQVLVTLASGIFWLVRLQEGVKVSHHTAFDPKGSGYNVWNNLHNNGCLGDSTGTAPPSLQFIFFFSTVAFLFFLFFLFFLILLLGKGPFLCVSGISICFGVTCEKAFFEPFMSLSFVGFQLINKFICLLVKLLCVYICSLIKLLCGCLMIICW